MRPLVLVHGTWSRTAGWHQPGSPLWKALEDRGYTVIQFKWSGYCGGVPGPVIVPKDSDIKPELELWRSAGEKLALFVRQLGLERPDVISHSHGLQVVSFAAAPLSEFGTVLSLSGPVRTDMALVREAARPHIARWIQVTDPTGADRTILAGQAFDGHVGWSYDLPEADLNISAPGQGHSGLTTNLDAWDALNLWTALKGDS